jgi:hypothetical protein
MGFALSAQSMKDAVVGLMPIDGTPKQRVGAAIIAIGAAACSPGTDPALMQNHLMDFGQPRAAACAKGDPEINRMNIKAAFTYEDPSPMQGVTGYGGTTINLGTPKLV